MRHEPWTTPDVGKRFERLALGIVDALDRGQLTQPAVTTFSGGAVEPAESVPRKPRKEKVRIDGPPTVIVDALHRGKYTSIGEAILKEKAGTKILVRKGTYNESLVIDKPLEIVGDGNKEDIILRASGADVIRFTASMGRLANLTLRQEGEGNWDACDIVKGRLDLEDCDIVSKGRAGIAIHDGAEPRVRRNRIHDCKEVGILFKQNGAGLIQDNEIVGNSYGIMIHDGNPTIQGNDISGSSYSGLMVGTRANPTIRVNRIHDNGQGGVFVTDRGAGLIEDNEISSNGYSGIEVSSGGDPVVRKNRIQGNREGIRVRKNGRGTFEGNILEGNKERGAWDIEPNCELNVKRSGNVEK